MHPQPLETGDTAEKGSMLLLVVSLLSTVFGIWPKAAYPA
jgi:hypothetical protein